MVWKQIGFVGVDSGQLVICDPCYIDSEWEKEPFAFNKEIAIHPDGTKEKIERCSKRWFELIDDINAGKIKLEEDKSIKPKHNFSYNACADKTLKNDYGQLSYKKGHIGVGTVFTSGFGDGFYEVLGNFINYGTKKQPDIRIAEVKIKLITDKELKLVKRLRGG